MSDNGTHKSFVNRKVTSVKKRLTMKGQVHKAYKVMVHLLDPRVIKSDKHIPLNLIKSAKGLLFLTVFKAGLIVAGNFGAGILIRKLEDGTWSGPVSVGVGGLGIGPQVGVTAVDTVLVLTTEEAIDTFCNSTQFKLGGNFSIAMGPVGRQGEAVFAPSYKKNVQLGESVSQVQSQSKLTMVSAYSYAHTKGVYLGAALEGTVLMHRPTDNKRYYCLNEVNVRDVLQGKIFNVGYDRDLHLLYQSLALVAQRAIEYGEFNQSNTRYFISQNEDMEYEDPEDYELLQKVNRDSLRLRQDVSKIFEKPGAARKSRRGSRPKSTISVGSARSSLKGRKSNPRPVSTFSVSSAKSGKSAGFSPVRQESQGSLFSILEKNFKNKNDDTLLGRGVNKLQFSELEWIKQLKMVVGDSGFLYTYGILDLPTNKPMANDFKAEPTNYYFDDFEYGMFSLIEKGNLDRSLARMRGILKFMYKYGFEWRYFQIQGPVSQEAAQFEDFYFKFAVNCGPDKDGAPTIGVDIGKLRPEAFSENSDAESELLQGIIWILRVSAADLKSFRSGITVVADLTDASKQNIPKTELRNKLRRLFNVIHRHSPIRIKKVLVVNATNLSAMKIAMSSVGKVILPSAIRHKTVFVNETNLDTYFAAESIPIGWGGTRVPFTRHTLGKYVQNQRSKYLKTLRSIAKLEANLERESTIVD